MFVEFCVFAAILLVVIIFIVCHIVSLLSYFFSQKIPARILDVETSNTYIRYCYEYELLGNVHQSWEPWYYNFNLIAMVFPGYKVGKLVYIRMNINDNEIIKKPVSSVIFMVGVIWFLMDKAIEIIFT